MQIYNSSNGVWLDQFILYDDMKNKKSSWVSKELIEFHLSCGKSLTLVSPELHFTDGFFDKELILEFWMRWKKIIQNINQANFATLVVHICTDFPIQLNEFLYE